MLEIGVADFDDTFGFGDFQAGEGIPIGGIGQAGLTARLAVRIRDSAEWDLSEGFVRMELVNVADANREPGIREFDVADELRCEDGWCYPTPIRVEISHMNKLPELEGTLVSIAASFVATADDSLTGSVFSYGYFEAIE